MATKNKNADKIILFIVLFVYVLLTIPFLSVSPPIWFDEGLLSEVSWQFVEEGKFAQPLWTGYLDYETFSTHPNYLYYLFLAISFKLGGLGIFQARIVSVISGFLLILSLHYVVKRTWSNKIADIAIILLALNPLFILSARMARQEMMTALFAFLCLGFLMVGVKEKKSSLIFLAGFFGTLTTLIHLNGLFICVAGFVSLLLMTFFFPQSLSRRKYNLLDKRRWRYIFYFIAGGVMTVIPFALFVFFHLDVFIYQFFELWAYRLPSSSSRMLTNIIAEPMRWTKGITTPLSMFIGLFGFLYCLPKAIKQSKEIVTYFSVYIPLSIIILCFTIFDYHKYYGYLVIVLPLFCILAGNMFVDFINKKDSDKSRKKSRKKIRRGGWGGNNKKIVAILLLLLVFTTYVGVVQYKVWRDRNANYEQYCNEVTEIIEQNMALKERIEEKVILADALFWFCFPEGNLRSIITFIWIHQATEKPYAEIFKEQKVDYIILDSSMYVAFHKDALQFDVTEEYIETVEACKIIGELHNDYYTKGKTDYNMTTIYECQKKCEKIKK